MSNSKLVAPRRRQWLHLLLLSILTGAAVFLWTAPLRRERALKESPFDQLIALSRRDQDDPRVFYHLGLRLHAFGQDAPARAAFQRAATLDGDDEEAWLAWASTAGALGNEQEAFAVLDNFTRRHPDSARAHVAFALFYREEAAHGRAFEEASAAARANPNDAAILRLVGIEAIELRRFDDAERVLKRGIARNPRDWQCRVALGNALKAQNRDDEAFASFQEAARLAQDQTTPLTAYGEAQLARARNAAEVEKAQKTLERAVETGPASAPAHLMLGKALLRQNRLAEAQQLLERAALLSPGFPGPHFELQRLYERLGDKARAAREERLHKQTLSYRLERYSLLSRIYQVKDDSETRLKLARLCAAHGEYAIAAREYRRLVGRKGEGSEIAGKELAALERRRPEAASHPIAIPMPPSSSKAMPNAGLLLHDADSMLAKKRNAEAARAYLNVLVRDPNSARALEGLGIALDAQGKHEEAFRVLNRALALDPKLTEAGFVLARLYDRTGFPDEAARRMEVVVAQAPKVARYHHGLGVAYSQSSAHYAQAEAAFRTAAVLSPDNAAYLRDLAAAEAKNHMNSGAESHYRKALGLAPNDADNLVGFGLFLLDQGAGGEREAEAERLLRRSLQIQSRNPYALIGLGRISLARGHPREAMESLQRAVSDLPGYEFGWFQLARAYEALGKREMAEECRRVFRRITDFRTELNVAEGLARQRMKDPNLRLKLARLYAKGGENAKAINQYQMCLALDPGNSAARKELRGFTDKLKAHGEMPAMRMIDGMILASAKLK